MEDYPLWGFGDYNKIVYTRGRTSVEAYKWAIKNWERGETITELPYLPLYVAKEYSKTHLFDWLHTMPKWLRNEEL